MNEQTVFRSVGPAAIVARIRLHVFMTVQVFLTIEFGEKTFSANLTARRIFFPVCSQVNFQTRLVNGRKSADFAYVSRDSPVNVYMFY